MINVCKSEAIYLELHIREFEYQNIIKQQFYKQLVVLSLYVLLLVFALESILYGFDYVWIILFVTSMAIINLNFRRKKKILGYDLVYIDENNRFFYNNLFIEMKDLENYVLSKETITLNFIDYSIVIEKNENLYDYLNQFVKNKKPINGKKQRLFVSCFALLFVFFSLSLGNLVLGSIYSYINHVEMISLSTILVPIIQITSIILGVALIFFVAKRFKKGIGLYVSLLLIVLYIALPFIMGNDIHRLDNDMAYTRQNQKLTLYSRYKKGYGKFERQITNVSNKAEVGNYQSVLYILEKQKDIRVYELSNDRDLKFYFAPDPFEMSNSQTSNEDTNESESQNQTEEANQETTAQESDTTDLENDPERVYFEKVYDLLIAQNKLDNPCFDYQYDAKGYPYAVVSTNDEYTLSLVFNKYKNNDEDYEIVLEKYIKKSSTQSLVDFYLVNTKTLEVTDQQRDYW